jgi:hypothetical protein
MLACNRSLIFALILSGTVGARYIAKAPQDYREDERERIGSLLQDKDSVLSRFFGRSKTGDIPSVDSAQKAEDAGPVDANALSVTKPEVEPDSSDRDRMFDVALKLLKDSPLNLVDRKAGKIETGSMKIEDFDNTGVCTYRISISIIGAKNIKISITSKEDSEPRLRKHEETMTKKILNGAASSC